MKWQTVDEMHGSKKKQMKAREDKMTFFEKHKPPQQNVEKKTDAKTR